MTNKSSPLTSLTRKQRDSFKQNEGSLDWQSTRPIGKMINPSESVNNIQRKNRHRIPYERLIVIAGLLQ
ncbi:MAG: hypothetical protein ABFD08_20490 [Syntrophomonas sp.]